MCISDSQLAEIAEVFKKFYLQKYSGRRLMWQNSLGHCILKATFPSGKKELAVSLFQTVILLLFNDKNELSFKEIQQQTAMGKFKESTNLIHRNCGTTEDVTLTSLWQSESTEQGTKRKRRIRG